MKVVFLDIDGVLVTERLFKRREGRQRLADELCVAALNRLLSESGASIVISSSWRFCGQNEMQRILEFWKVEGAIIGCTPDLTHYPGQSLTRADFQEYKFAKRGEEIQAWLDQHPEVERFVILDDECDMAHLEPWLVKTNFQDGFTEAHVAQALQVLGQQPPTEVHAHER